jgi:hypothetical protein
MNVSFRSGHVRRHQVRRELDARKLEIERACKCRNQQCLRQTGHTDEQAIASGEQRNQRLFDYCLLANDDFPQLLGDALTGNLEFLGNDAVIVTVGRSDGSSGGGQANPLISG